MRGEKRDGWGEVIVRKLFETWGMDTRSLALYRVLLAMVTIMDAIDRIPDTRAHYSDEGYISRQMVISKMSLPAYVSIHMANGSPPFAFVLFCVQILIAIFLLVGWRTRIMTIITWYLNISLQARSPIVLHNGDVYIRMMLFFAIFLPLGAQWSIDKIMSNPKYAPSGPKQPEDYRHFSLGGSVGSIMQLNFVYFFAVLHKKELGYHIWFEEGSATYWALASLPYYRTPIGDFFVSLPRVVLQYLTWGVLYWELLGWFFLVFPWKTHVFRLIGILGFFSLHFGFGACMRLEQFVWIGCSATMCLLPPWIWDAFVPRLRDRFKSVNIKPLVVSYSSRALPLVQLIDTFFLIPSVTFVPLPSKDDEAAPQGISSSLVVECPSLGYRLSDARALTLLLYWSPVLWPLHFLARTSYAQSLISWYFYLIARTSEVHLDVDSRIRVARQQSTTFFSVFITVVTSKRFWANLLGFFLVLYTTAWNGSNVGLCSFPNSLREISHLPMLYQSWQMFSPPPQHIYHHNLELALKNGTSVELIKAGGLFDWTAVPMHFDAPLPWYPNYGDHRHWKYWENYNWHPESNEVRLEFGRWVCREWNSRHTGDQIVLKHYMHYSIYSPGYALLSRVVLTHTDLNLIFKEVDFGSTAASDNFFFFSKRIYLSLSIVILYIFQFRVAVKYMLKKKRSSRSFKMNFIKHLHHHSAIQRNHSHCIFLQHPFKLALHLGTRHHSSLNLLRCGCSGSCAPLMHPMMRVRGAMSRPPPRPPRQPRRSVSGSAPRQEPQSSSETPPPPPPFVAYGPPRPPPRDVPRAADVDATSFEMNETLKIWSHLKERNRMQEAEIRTVEGIYKAYAEDTKFSMARSAPRLVSQRAPDIPDDDEPKPVPRIPLGRTSHTLAQMAQKEITDRQREEKDHELITGRPPERIPRYEDFMDGTALGVERYRIFREQYAKVSGYYGEEVAKNFWNKFASAMDKYSKELQELEAKAAAELGADGKAAAADGSKPPPPAKDGAPKPAPGSPPKGAAGAKPSPNAKADEGKPKAKGAADEKKKDEAGGKPSASDQSKPAAGAGEKPAPEGAEGGKAGAKAGAKDAKGGAKPEAKGGAKAGPKKTEEIRLSDPSVDPIDEYVAYLMPEGTPREEELKWPGLPLTYFEWIAKNKEMLELPPPNAEMKEAIKSLSDYKFQEGERADGVLVEQEMSKVIEDRAHQRVGGIDNPVQEITRDTDRYLSDLKRQSEGQALRGEERELHEEILRVREKVADYVSDWSGRPLKHWWEHMLAAPVRLGALVLALPVRILRSLTSREKDQEGKESFWLAPPSAPYGPYRYAAMQIVHQARLQQREPRYLKEQGLVRAPDEAAPFANMSDAEVLATALFKNPAYDQQLTDISLLKPLHRSAISLRHSLEVLEARAKPPELKLPEEPASIKGQSAFTTIWTSFIPDKSEIPPPVLTKDWWHPRGYTGHETMTSDSFDEASRKRLEEEEQEEEEEEEDDEEGEEEGEAEEGKVDAKKAAPAGEGKKAAAAAAAAVPLARLHAAANAPLDDLPLTDSPLVGKAAAAAVDAKKAATDAMVKPPAPDAKKPAAPTTADAKKAAAASTDAIVKPPAADAMKAAATNAKAAATDAKAAPTDAKAAATDAKAAATDSIVKPPAADAKAPAADAADTIDAKAAAAASTDASTAPPDGAAAAAAPPPPGEENPRPPAELVVYAPRLHYDFKDHSISALPHFGGRPAYKSWPAFLFGVFSDWCGAELGVPGGVRFLTYLALRYNVDSPERLWVKEENYRRSQLQMPIGTRWMARFRHVKWEKVRFVPRPEVHWRDFNNVLWMRGIEICKRFPSLGTNFFDIRRRLKPVLLQYFRGLHLIDSEMLAPISTPNHVDHMFKTKEEIEAEMPPPSGPIMHVLNQTLIRRVFKISVKSLAMWNDVVLITTTCVLRTRPWLRNMETGETMYGGPKRRAVFKYIVKLAGFQVPEKPGELSWKIVDTELFKGRARRKRRRRSRRHVRRRFQ